MLTAGLLVDAEEDDRKIDATDDDEVLKNDDIRDCAPFVCCDDIDDTTDGATTSSPLPYAFDRGLFMMIRDALVLVS